MIGRARGRAQCQGARRLSHPARPSPPARRRRDRRGGGRRGCAGICRHRPSWLLLRRRAAGQRGPWPTPALLRPGMVGDWRAADRRGWISLAAACVSRSRRLGDRSRRHDAACRHRTSELRLGPSVSLPQPSRSSTLFRSALRSRVEQNGRRFAAGGERRAGGSAGCPGRHPHRHRRTRTQLGMGVAVCGLSALSAYRLAIARVHRLPRALSCCTAPWFEETRQDDSQLVRGRRPRLRRSDEVGSGDRQAQACHRR